MKKKQRKFLRKCVRKIQSKGGSYLSETDHVCLKHLAYRFAKRKRQDAGFKGDNGRSFFNLN